MGYMQAPYDVNGVELGYSHFRTANKHTECGWRVELSITGLMCAQFFLKDLVCVSTVTKTCCSLSMVRCLHF